MKINQIADTLNTVFQEIIGESAVVEEDLSNLVDVGRTIISSTQWGDNFENYTKALIDKVGKTIFVDRPYKAHGPNIWKDSWEYGSILEKVRCEVGDYLENPEWALVDGLEFTDIFTFSKPEVEAKYFNSKTTFQVKISITKKQMKSAFNSASDMNKFISMIENRIMLKMELAKEALTARTIANLIAEKFKSENNIVNLLALYIEATGDSTTTAETALTNKEFLRFAAKTILMYKEFLAKPSILYNDDQYTTFTPADRLQAVFLADLSKALETTLYSDTFNDEFVKLAGYSNVAYWQGSGLTNSFADRSQIDVLPASSGGIGDAQIHSGIVAVLFDEYACMACNEEPDVRSIFNPEGNFYNYWYSFDCSYFNDLGENVVVFTIQDVDDDDEEGTGTGGEGGSTGTGGEVSGT